MSGKNKVKKEKHFQVQLLFKQLLKVRAALEKWNFLRGWQEIIQRAPWIFALSISLAEANLFRA